MAKTRADLAQRALEKLMVVGAGQAADAEDSDKVDGVIDSMVNDLNQRKIYYVQDLEDIEVAAFEWLAEYLAYLVSADFGLPMDETKRLRAEYMLRAVSSSWPTFQAMAVDYF